MAARSVRPLQLTGLLLTGALLLSACVAAPSATPAPDAGAPGASDYPELHRGLLTNEKASPDSGQSSGGDGRSGSGP